ncbi:Hypothetical protein R9X50_00093600 [Acrodontium crateriforme]|uniref:Heme haloperoxidase family profile domain-containing protein n=1 Tax=Acrodontium crateriforme TaxID=150365 RepID=A0AAQ3M1H6_9PEZI|nr:Hypothetical protein R9X50_00093600 [Acrodontium crateriforme]
MLQSALALGGCLVASASAFPPSPRGVLGDLADIGKDAVDVLLSGSSSVTPFNAQLQLVDVTGLHAWQAPGPTDQRGPCPGLNALANHGYLPRNGVASIVDLISATTAVFGMGVDLATILSVYGAVFDGAAVGWSIGGGEHTGIGGSHNNYESDSSPTRADLNQYGSNINLILSQFKELYDMQPNAATANYNLDVLFDFRASRYHESVANNPNFFYGPFTGTTVTQAAFTFIYRYMANHTAEAPDGVLNQANLKSFFAISGDSDSLTWTPGYERIPNNWYRRGINDSYGVLGLANDISALAAKYPFISQPGCNQGKVNSFENINTGNTDASAYDFTNPLDGICYGVASAVSAANVIPIVNGVVQELLLPIQNALNCPTLTPSNTSVGDDCPGHSLYGGPTGPVAAGAIQN